MPLKERKANSSNSPVQTKRKLRWTVVIFLLIGGLINYLDRANLSIAAPEMIKELGLTTTEIGLLGTVFSWSYAIMQLPSGWLIDRFGTRILYSISILWYSIATLLMGSMSKMSSFIATRIFLGMGEAPTWPTGAKITSYWFPKKERGLATGIWDSSSKLGPAIAPPLLVTLMISFGWRSLFYITGILGILFAIFFILLYRNPDKSRRISKEELEYIKSGGGGVEGGILHSKMKWIHLFKHRTMWGMILGFFCTIWIFNIFMVFLPLYLVEVHGVKLQALGIISSIPWIGGIFGGVFSGYVTKKIVDKGIASPINSKRMVISICALAAALIVILVPFVKGIWITIILLTAALCFISAITGNAWAIPGDVAPQSMVASVGAIQNFGGYFGGAFSPVIAGWIVQTTGSYSLAFISGGIIAGCAAICYWFIVRKPIED